MTRGYTVSTMGRGNYILVYNANYTNMVANFCYSNEKTARENVYPNTIGIWKPKNKGL